MSGPLRGLADSLAGVDTLPTPARAVFSHYAEGGTLELTAIRLQQRVEDEVAAMVEDAYDDVESVLEAEFGRQDVTFEYDTKLTMPVELTLSHLYRRALEKAPPGVNPVAGTRRTDPLSRFRRRFATYPESAKLVTEVRRAEDVAELVVVALLDGDMRDAINDAEYEDFHVDFELAASDRGRVASIAQEVLQAAVQERFAAFPDSVRATYDDAVDRSEAHQDRDPHFRELMVDAVLAAEADAVSEAMVEDAREEPECAVEDVDAETAQEALREEYKFAGFAEAGFEAPPELFADAELDLPYLVTQYGRVGVIYHGMIEMFREAGIELSMPFERSVVLAIIGAQLWLDDVDDFDVDMADGQLTPVTAEYLLAGSDAEAYEEVLNITERYLDRARDAAHDSDAPVTGIAVEYIRHSGEPAKLPR